MPHAICYAMRVAASRPTAAPARFQRACHHEGVGEPALLAERARRRLLSICLLVLLGRALRVRVRFYCPRGHGFGHAWFGPWFWHGFGTAYAHASPQNRAAYASPALCLTCYARFLWRRAFRLPDGASLSSLWTIYTVSVGVTSARAGFGANDRAGRFWHAFWHGSPHVEDCFRTVSAARSFLLSHESNRSERANSNAA